MTRRAPPVFLLACLAASATGFLVYLPGLPGDFVFDDFSSIIGNPAVTAPHHGLAGYLHALFTAPVGGLLRPLAMLSFMGNASLWGLGAFGFKLTNVAIHVACGLLLIPLGREILRAYASARGRAPDEAAIKWMSLASATLWLVHPLNLTVVLYVVQRETSLAALFSIAAMLAYLRARRRGLETRNGRVLLWVVAPLCVLLGLLCKETAALTLLYLLVIELTLLHGRDAQGRPSRQVQAFYLAFLVLPLLVVATVVAVDPGFFFASYAGRNFTLYERLLSECRIVLDYLRWVFLPDLRQLGLYHDDFLPSRGLLAPASTLLSLLVLLGLLAAAWIWRRTLPLLSFGILWFFAGHLLESTVLPLELMFEHRNYLPLFGVILACVGLSQERVPATEWRALAAALVAAALLLASITAVRALDWRSELDFARSESAHHPGSPRAVTELQWAYMNYVIETRDERLIPAAVAAAEQAKRVDAGSINQDVGLAYMYARIGKLPEAAASLRAAAARAPTADPTPTLQLSLQSLMTLAKPEFRPLHPDIRTVYLAATANPRVSAAPCYYADVWNTYARFEEDSGEVREALTGMHRAVNLCPGKAELHYNMGNMLLHFGDTRDARSEIEAMRRLDDFRFQDDLAALEMEYRRQTGSLP